jgi:hypothetical protein
LKKKIRPNCDISIILFLILQEDLWIETFPVGTEVCSIYLIFFLLIDIYRVFWFSLPLVIMPVGPIGCCLSNQVEFLKP